MRKKMVFISKFVIAPLLLLSDMDGFKTAWEKYVMGLRQGYAVTVQ